MAEQREFLREVIARIVVGQTGLQMAVVQSSLQGALLGGQPDHRSKSKQDVFTITIDAQIKRCGWEVRLIVPSNSGTQMPTRPALPLIKAVARVHHWPERIMRGEFQSRQAIAKFLGVDQRYAGRILQFAFLAPDIVDAILEGQPAGRSDRPETLARSVPELGRTAEAARVYAYTLLERPGLRPGGA